MTFYTDGEALYSWVTPPAHVCGWKNILHGGILTTILDETMGWAVICLLKRFPLTKETTVSFSRPVLLDKGEIRVESRIVQYPGDRQVIVQGEVYQGNDEPSVSALGTFGLFSVEAIQRFNVLDEAALSTFRGLLRQL
jgi:acyl-coenzyme A thioesterase PaaI-like protein